MGTTDNVVALTRLELSDAIRSRWLLFTCVAYAAVFAVFTWLGLRESTVLGFTGLSRVILNVANAVVLSVPLLALVATSQSVVRARSSGLLEMLLTQPCRRGEWFTALALSRALVLVGPLVALLLVAGVLGLVWEGDRETAHTAFRSFGICAALAWAFTGVGLWISASARTPERAVVYALIAWIAAAALHDFALVGILLRWNIPAPTVFALAAANPVEAARLGILGGMDPDLSILGPVGFWLANTLGNNLSLLVAVVWPTVLGTATALLAWRQVQRFDAVG
ncbi:MAG: ABC transporter permease [Myxococcota bacterium]